MHCVMINFILKTYITTLVVFTPKLINKELRVNGDGNSMLSRSNPRSVGRFGRRWHFAVARLTSISHLRPYAVL